VEGIDDATDAVRSVEEVDRVFWGAGLQEPGGSETADPGTDYSDTG
jgi:hypothetical protein